VKLLGFLLFLILQRARRPNAGKGSSSLTNLSVSTVPQKFDTRVDIDLNFDTVDELILPQAHDDRTRERSLSTSESLNSIERTIVAARDYAALLKAIVEELRVLFSVNPTFQANRTGWPGSGKVVG
jgi:hypothetical protein